jgi:hypothetical protein
MSHRNATREQTVRGSGARIRRIACRASLVSTALVRATPALADPSVSEEPPTSDPALVAEPAASSQPRHLIAVNPVFIPFGTLTGEYELSITRHASLGASGWYEYRDVRARWAYSKALF